MATCTPADEIEQFAIGPTGLAVVEARDGAAQDHKRRPVLEGERQDHGSIAGGVLIDEDENLQRSRGVYMFSQVN